MASDLDTKLSEFEARYLELEKLLQDKDIYQDLEKVQQLSREQAKLQEVVDIGRKLKQVRNEIDGAKQMLGESHDKDLVEFAEDELNKNQLLESELISTLEKLLIPKNPNDDRDSVSGTR